MGRAPRPYVQAAQRWGYLADAQAHKYGLANGATLLLKIASGESGFNMGAVSSAGARGGTQFMPSTRKDYIERYGVDPWKSPEEAIHATAIFMHTSGLAGYNPGGGQSYIRYILKQPVSVGREDSPSATAPKPAAGEFPPHGSLREAPPKESGGLGGDLMHVGLVGALVLGGAGLVGLGVTRVFGSAQKRSQAA